MPDKLYLIDGHALIFKMYYAFLRRPMINSKGSDMSILFGFTKYILELLEREQPTHIAVAFDPPGGTFRNTIFPEYKANRAETPQLVIDALEPLTEICHALNIPTLMVPGFEADDVIGTVAKKSGGEGMQVFMVTPDKDYGQLIDKNIFQLKPGKAGGADELVDRAAICEKYGISSPLQVIEMLTLCGDSSDNVPGVKGVGEVGAGKLISKYGSVENIYAHLDELPESQRQMFRDAEEHIGLSHELVTIRTDVPVDADIAGMKVNRDFRPEIAELFEVYEFNSLRKYLDGMEAATPAPQHSLEVAMTDAASIITLSRETGRCCILTESSGKSIFSDIKGMTVAVCTEGKCFAAGGGCGEFQEILEDASIEKCGYDLKFQLNLLDHNGIGLRGRLLDTGLMHYLINPEQSHDIEVLAKSYLGVDLDAGEEESQPVSLFDAVEETPSKNRMAEAAACFLLTGKIRTEIEDSSVNVLYNEMEEPLLRVLAAMEREGVKVDISRLRAFADELGKELDAREARIREMADEPELNISSPKQIGQVLFEKLAIDPKAKKSAKGSYSTDETTLTELAGKHPIVDEILEFRAVKKLLSTYIEPFPSYVSPLTGKIHTTFNQALTATGRLSSSNPNLQNIPIRTERGKEIREAFVPSRPDGIIMSADYSQIELRIMAHLCRDEHLIEAFRKGVDVHVATASRIFGIPDSDVTPDRRRIAKMANFGIMYGISAFGLSQRLRIARSEAKKIIDDYFSAFPSIKDYIAETAAKARERGFVETLFGRRRYLPDINSKNAVARALAERNAVNAPIQGTSADIIKIAMIEVSRRIAEEGLESRMVLQIHDELLFDAVESEADRLKRIVVETMENVISLSVPLTVDCNYGKNWLEAH